MVEISVRQMTNSFLFNRDYVECACDGEEFLVAMILDPEGRGVERGRGDEDQSKEWKPRGCGT
jgi:hypothetical protein